MNKSSIPILPGDMLSGELGLSHQTISEKITINLRPNKLSGPFTALVAKTSKALTGDSDIFAIFVYFACFVFSLAIRQQLYR